MLYKYRVPILYQHPNYELNGRWDSEIGIAQFWFPHNLVNTTCDVNWRRRQDSVLSGLSNVSLVTTVELIPTNDLDVISVCSELPEIEVPVNNEKGALAVVSARIELPDDGYTLEDAPPDGYYYLDPESGGAIVPSASILIDYGTFNPLPPCAELIVSTYPVPKVVRI